MGISCTGCPHRSVYVAEKIHKYLLDKGYKSRVHHRDIDKDPKYAVKENT